MHILKTHLQPLASNPVYRLEYFENGEVFVKHLQMLLDGASANAPSLPFLLFLDIHMPRVNGFDVLAYIRKQPQLKHIIVFIMSSLENPDLIQQAYQYHVAGYLEKNKLGNRYEYLIQLIQVYTQLVSKPLFQPELKKNISKHHFQKTGRRTELDP